MIDRRALVFGDSFVAGAGDPEGLGWTGRVAAAAFGAGLAVTTYALGVRGQTSEQVAARWEVEAPPRLVEPADCRVAFSFGANDATLLDGATRTAPDGSLAALAACLDGAAARGVASFVVGPGPVGQPAHDERLAALDAAFAQTCTARGVPYAGRCWPTARGRPRPSRATARTQARVAMTPWLASCLPAAGWTGCAADS